MSAQNLIANVTKTESFEKHFAAMVKLDIRGQLNNITDQDPIAHLTDDTWSYLLKVANLLVVGEEKQDQERCLRIVQACLAHPEASSYLKDYAANILMQLANYPAIELARTRNYIDKKVANLASIGDIIAQEKIDFGNSMVSSTGEIVRCNAFQKSVWESYHDFRITSASAPTAAGKSYVLYQILLEACSSVQEIDALFIVPTRALINQVTRDITQLFSDRETPVEIITLPIREQDSNPANKKVFVFTQERLHLYTQADKDHRLFDLVFIDEAHKVGDSYRGILLQHAVQRAVTANTRVIYASPFSSNPEVFSDNHPTRASFHPVHSPLSTVSQNIFWVTQKPRYPKKWTVQYIGGEPVEVGTVLLKSTPNSIVKRCSLVAAELGSEVGGNLVYVNIPSDAEKTATTIIDYLSLPEVESQEIDALIDLCKKTVHKNFLLPLVLRYGVAFHYGNLPQLIREGIEKLFGQGNLKFLVCTSTLVEGVNMSCKNIFLRGPKKGRTTPMNKEDFWNLAGRAGRWGKEFQGNIFCIDVDNPKIWPYGVPRAREEYVIHTSVSNVLSDYDGLLEYISDKMPRSSDLTNIERDYLVSYLIELEAAEGLADSPIAHQLTLPALAELKKRLSSTLEEFSLPVELIVRNPGISPYAIKELYGYFVENLNRIEEFVPAGPSSNDAVESFTAVFHRINKFLSPKVLGFSRGRVFMLAILVVQWISGYPLHRLIGERERRNSSSNINSIIREVLNDVETVARFLAPKYIACYSDVLKCAAREHGVSARVAEIEDIQLSLEFGVSSLTHFSLIRLGMSRAAAIAIAEYMGNSDLSKDECLAWLRTHMWRSLDIPELVLREIEEVVGEIET